MPKICRFITVGLCLLGLELWAAKTVQKSLSWKNLTDPKTDKKSLEGRVRVPGFLVPLEYDQNNTTEFLLVPGLPGCAHVPPPPPEHTIHVKMEKGKKAALTWEPVWISGTLKSLKCNKAGYGEACFEMQGLALAKFDKKDMSDPALLPPPPSPSQFDCKGRDKFEPICQSVQGELIKAPLLNPKSKNKGDPK